MKECRTGKKRKRKRKRTRKMEREEEEKERERKWSGDDPNSSTKRKRRLVAIPERPFPMPAASSLSPFMSLLRMNHGLLVEVTKGTRPTTADGIAHGSSACSNSPDNA